MESTVIKKIQLGLLSVSAIALLAACGGGTEEEMPPMDNQTEETQSPEEESQEGTQDGDIQDEITDEATDGSGSEESSVDTSNGILNVEFPVTLDQATQSFYDTFNENVNIDQVEFDEDDGTYEYQISGWDEENEYELDVNAETGDVVEQETDDDDDDEETIAFDNIISPQEAMQAAVDTADTEFVESWDLDVDDGTTVYDVELENADDDDVTIDAETGDVVDQ